MLMVRGIFTSLRFPYVQFPCKTLSGDTLYPIVWEAIQRLELLGCKVLAIICDGASSNRSFFRIHSTKNSSEAQEQLAYRTRNPFSCDRDRTFLWFVSDAPHLMKTTRNCWTSPKRNLWNCGKDISWNHLRRLYYQDSGAQRCAGGLSLVPKLKFEHLKLSSFSKMRVDLAVQEYTGCIIHMFMCVYGY
ncbi:uncharacterized protein LOC134185850 isoform X2 [Corticium candelabrum]|uniref:uncharacterized protein LOC134185850 isoform X2 n=1 Tax=Corticium candelabrum TaxID=121492 RepID=UPI002E2696A3|nr:uncharacterized protein LOC134185850 isoform X2 [Corticium candelabrum]